MRGHADDTAQGDKDSWQQRSFPLLRSLIGTENMKEKRGEKANEKRWLFVSMYSYPHFSRPFLSPLTLYLAITVLLRSYLPAGRRPLVVG